MKKALLIGFSILLATGCGCSNSKKENIDIDKLPDISGNENINIKDDGTKENSSSKLSSKKTFESYEITDAKLSTDKNGRTTLVINIKNTGTTETKAKLVDIVFTDKNGNDVSKLPIYIKALKANETIELPSSIDKDLSNAYNFYVKNK